MKSLKEIFLKEEYPSNIIVSTHAKLKEKLKVILGEISILWEKSNEIVNKRDPYVIVESTILDLEARIRELEEIFIDLSYEIKKSKDPNMLTQKDFESQHDDEEYPDIVNKMVGNR